MDIRDSTKRQTPQGTIDETDPAMGPATREGLENTTENRRWSRVLVGAAASVVIIGIGAVLTFVNVFGGGSDTVSPAAGRLFTIEDALAVSDAFFNAGDADAVLALFTPDATIEDNLVGEWSRSEWEMVLAWNIAQGATRNSPDCTVAEEVPGEAVTVTCESGTHNAPAQAIGAPTVPTMDTVVVTPDGIRLLTSVYGQPDFQHSTIPFDRWVQNNHPEDVDKVGFAKWTSVEEAEQNGLLTAQYAQEWAAYLEAKGCMYPDACYRLP